MRKMGIGLGVGINRSNYAQGIFNAYSARVVADGGVVESGSCVDAVSSLLQSASLLLIPSGYKGGKLYAEIPTNGNGDLTWTRGGDAFRTNASGVLQRVPWNLLKYSEDFSNTSSWTQDPTSGSITITANYATAPNGTNTADRIQITKGVSYSQLYQTSSVISGAVYTISVYLKSLSGTPTITTLYDGGAKGTQTLTTDWVRYTFSFTATSSTVYPMIALYSGNSSSMDILAWGYQLVEGTTAQTYLPTTDRLNFPRLSYMYGSCPSALLEPQRTNLALRSQEFDNALWIKQGATVTSDQTTSPDGNTTADSLIENTALGFHYATQLNVGSGTVSMSVYAKPNGRDWLYLHAYNVSGGDKGAYFNVSSGTIGTIDSGISASIQSASNGFYRCQITYTNANPMQIVLSLANANNGRSYTGDGTKGLYIWGAQSEVGAYPTTYIPTTSATATRVADSFSRNNIYTNGLISASGGTWFVELRNNISYVRDGVARFGIGDTSAINLNSLHIGSLSSTTTRQQIYKTVAGSYFLLYTTLTDTVKIAIKWNGTSADVFVNGTKVVSATSFTTTNMELLKDSGGLTAPTFIQQMALFPTPLSDTDCTTITTL